jgi:exosortase
VYCKRFAIVLPVVALGLYYHDVARQLAVRWYNDPNYSHGFFVPLFSLYFLWEKRSGLAAIPWKGSLLGLPVILAGAGLKGMGHLLFSPYLAGVSLVVVIAGVVLLCWGRQMMRHTWVPVAFLFLMLPLPRPVYESVALPLQRFAAMFATVVLQAVSIPVLREGNIIHFAGKSLEVAQACSGMRLLVGFVAMGIAVAYLSGNPIWHKAIVVVSAFPIAVVANAIRVTGTGVLYHHVSEKAAEGFFHAFSGWLMFLLALGVLMLESLVLLRLFAPPASSSEDGAT